MAPRLELFALNRISTIHQQPDHECTGAKFTRWICLSSNWGSQFGGENVGDWRRCSARSRSDHIAG